MALLDHTIFTSGLGVTADNFSSNFLQGNIVASDPPRHIELRKVMLPTHSPKELEGLRNQFNALATKTVEELIGRDEFDIIREFAKLLPLTIVCELVGLPEAGKDNMLKWPGAAFNILGFQNKNAQTAIKAIEQMRGFINKKLTAENVKENSWAARIFDLVETKEVPEHFAPFLIRYYIRPSLDTTISAICHLVQQLSLFPHQWELLCSRPELAKRPYQKPYGLDHQFVLSHEWCQKMPKLKVRSYPRIPE